MATKLDEQRMRDALKEADRALSVREKPVGAVIVHKTRLVARAHHQTRTLHDPTAHAVVIAITQAANALQSEQLTGCTVYVTQEPCCMCMGAILLSGVSRLVVGCDDPKEGAAGSVIDLPAHERLNKKLIVTKGVLALECAAILRKAAVGAKF